MEERLKTSLGRLRLPAKDMSVTEALARLPVSPAARAAAAAFVEGFEAAPPDETSARWIARARTTDAIRAAMRFVGGYDSVIEWLRRGARVAGIDVVRTGWTAVRVEWKPGRVRVRCASPTGAPLAPVEAERLVVTLPVGVLGAPPDSPGAVRFEPALPPRYVRALNLSAMGHVLKLTLQFRSPLWPEEVAFLRGSDGPMTVWWTLNPLYEPRIVGWSTGARALALLATGQPGILDGAVRSLAGALGIRRARVEHELAAWWTHDWSADPFSRGAYAFARVGGSDAWRTLAAPLRGTLFFAGEAICEPSEAGTVHGAIASGRRAARLVVG
jgi:monoamine oxidase